MRLLAAIFGLLLVLPGLALAQSNSLAGANSPFLSLTETTNSETAKERGDKDYETGHFGWARRAYIDAMAQRPRDDKVLWHLAYCCFAVSNYAEAKSYYARYEALNPGTGQGHFWIGCCLEQMNEEGEAEKEFRACIRLDPGYDLAYDQLAYLLTQRGEAKEAATFERMAIAVKGGSEERGAILAADLIGARDYSKAVSFLQAFIKDHPTNAYGYICMAKAEHGLRQNTRARWHAEKAIRLDPKEAEAESILGDILYSQRNYREAGDAYGRAGELDPQNYFPHYWRGWSLLRQHRDNEALTEMERAQQLEPSGHRLLTLLFTYLRTGKYARALGAHPVAWPLSVSLLLLVSIGGFYLAITWTLASSVVGPGICLAFFWTALFFVLRYAWMFFYGLMPRLRAPNIEAFALVVAPLMFVVVALVLFSECSWGAAYRFKPSYPSRLWIKALAAYAVSYLFNFAHGHVVHPPPSRSGAYILEAMASNPVCVFFYSVLVTPMSEEILVRGLLYGALRRYVGLWAIPLSSLAFAAYHFDAPHFAGLFVMGVSFCWMREISGSVWLPFVFHALNNGIFYLWTAGIHSGGS